MKRIAILMAALLLVCGISAAGVENTATTTSELNWLVGKWELTYDSEGSPKDWLEFTADGHASSLTPEGRRIPGRYALKESQIEVLYSFNGKMIPFVFRFNAARDELTTSSQKTKGFSRYKKVQ